MPTLIFEALVLYVLNLNMCSHFICSFENLSERYVKKLLSIFDQWSNFTNTVFPKLVSEDIDFFTKILIVFPFYELSFLKKEENIQGMILIKEIWYLKLTL